MDRKTLEQYPYIVAEIQNLKDEANIIRGGSMLTDVVTGSSPEHPYIQHSISITGVKDSTELREVQMRLAKLQDLKNQIEDFMNHLPNLKIRKIVELKAFKGMKWEEIADEITRISGRDISSGSVKNDYHRLWKKF